jgi:hypothetical protein
MDGFEGEIGLESVGMEVRSEIGGMGEDHFFNSREGVGGDGKSAAGEERGERGGWVDLGWCVEFSHGVESGEDVVAAGIGENTEKRSVGVLPGDGAGAADREDGAVPRGGHAVGGGDGGANS